MRIFCLFAYHVKVAAVVGRHVVGHGLKFQLVTMLILVLCVMVVKCRVQSYNFKQVLKIIFTLKVPTCLVLARGIGTWHALFARTGTKKPQPLPP